MRSASDFDSFEDAWRQYLVALQKVRVKTERGCQPVRESFEPWQGKFKRQRKKDQLLHYLRHARNADEQSIRVILDDIPGQTVTTSSSDTVYVGNLVVTTSPRIELRPVEDRGKWYDPPVEHLGKALAERDPLKVAELGLTFYAGFVEQAERKFFESRPVKAPLGAVVPRTRAWHFVGRLARLDRLRGLDAGAEASLRTVDKSALASVGGL